MDEQETSRQLTPERLIEYEGPRIGKHLRREMNQQVALLYEKVMFLRLVDPGFERELEEMGALEFLDRYSERLREEQEQNRKNIEELERSRAERLGTQAEANEEAPAE
jgi:hypothetical protein